MVKNVEKKNTPCWTASGLLFFGFFLFQPRKKEEKNEADETTSCESSKAHHVSFPRAGWLSGCLAAVLSRNPQGVGGEMELPSSFGERHNPHGRLSKKFQMLSNESGATE